MLWVVATTMWPQGAVLQVYLGTLLLSTAFSLSNDTYSLASLCDKFKGRWETILETDTVIHLHDGAPSVKNCTLVIKTFTSSTIYVKLKYWTEPDPSPQCTTELQLYEPGSPIKRLRDKSCLYPINAGHTQAWSTGGTELHATFTSTSGPHQFKPSTKSGLSIIFIRSTDSEKCQSSKYFKCDGMCIDNRLLCDKISHCIKGQDEILSRCKHTVNAPNPATHTTAQPLVSTTPAELTSDIYLWLPLIVVIVFTIVMLALILAGRGAANCSDHRYGPTENDDGLRLETNAGFSEGGPPTPPPTYSYIERQTSYVSHISQTDSQISIPPAYEDAVDVADDPMSWRRRFRRHLSRSSSRSSGTSRPSNNRHRLFQRSMSAQEAPSTQGRFLPDAARSRHSSDQTAGQGANRDSVTSDSDSVFIETPGTPTQSLSPNMASAPSALENVSEVDETLGSSLMLGPVGDHNGNIAQNAAVNNTAATQPGVVGQNGGPRPILARSISDVTSGQPVIFSVD